MGSSGDWRRSDRELCRVCHGNGVVRIHHGVSVCDHCNGNYWEPPSSPTPPDAALVERLRELMDAVEAWHAREPWRVGEFVDANEASIRIHNAAIAYVAALSARPRAEGDGDDRTADELTSARAHPHCPECRLVLEDCRCLAWPPRQRAEGAGQ